jgi:hypothetical protein
MLKKLMDVAIKLWLNRESMRQLEVGDEVSSAGWFREGVRRYDFVLTIRRAT